MTPADFGPMTEREILVMVATDVAALQAAVGSLTAANASTLAAIATMNERVTRLQTQVEERTTSRKTVAGLAGLVSIAITAILEFARRAQQ